MPRRDLTVIKLGEATPLRRISPIGSGRSREAKRVSSSFRAGGPLANAVRDAQPKMGFDDRTAHRMALLAMEQYGCALASYIQRLVLADSRAAIERALGGEQVPVWLPARMVLAAREIPWSWDVTSDSLAAWLAEELGASRLLLVKRIEVTPEGVCAKELAAGES